MLQLMPIDLESPLGRVGNLNGSMRKSLSDYVRPRPTGLEFSGTELQPQIEQMNLISNLKLLVSFDVIIMNPFCLFLV